MQVSHPRHYRFTISVSKSSSFSFLPNRYSCKNSVMCILNCKRLDSLYYAPIKSRNGTFDSPQSIATPSAFVAFVHFSNFLYVSFAESFSLTQLNSRITFWHYGRLSVPGKRVCGIMHYAPIIVSNPERVGSFLWSFLKISGMIAQNIIPLNRDVFVPFKSALLVQETNGVHQFVYHGTFLQYTPWNLKIHVLFTTDSSHAAPTTSIASRDPDIIALLTGIRFS